MRPSAAGHGRAAAPVFAALGDRTRLALVARLVAHGPRSIKYLASGSAITRQAITKHLHVLARAGLVRHSRRGRERIWKFEMERLDIARQYLDEISKRWDRALDRLKNFVED
jgi:DNA-binding transcriptional ArsR family regulator